MKKVLTVVLSLGILLAGTAAFAHMWGGGQGYGPGYGMGPGMMWGGGPGYGQGDGNVEDNAKVKKFLDDTVDLRQKINDKMFEMREVYRTGDEAKADKVYEEVEKLRKELSDKADKAGLDDFGPGRGFGKGKGGYGPGYGMGPGMMWGGPGYGQGYGPGGCGGPGYGPRW